VTDRLSDQDISGTLRRALGCRDLVTEEDTSVIFHDLSMVRARIGELLELFPPSTLHAVAIKANPLPAILSRIRDLGVGLEAASVPELRLATGAGFSPREIVFDSPAKTSADLEHALALGVHVNADSLPELERIASLLPAAPPGSTIGLRINPQTGAGAIRATGVAARQSKFGVPLVDARGEIEAAFRAYPWLTCAHVHVGSQGCPVDLLVDGVAAVFDFVSEVNGATGSTGKNGRIRVVDIGGGLPVSYHRDRPGPTLAEYARKLRDRLPALFTSEYRIITEFGRYLHAPAGWVASRVEYVKGAGGARTVILHVGADLFLRECYHPDDWPHEILLLNPDGGIKDGPVEAEYVLAGPLCFAGDVICRGVALPRVEAGDWIVIRDAGAYTLSMWSRYNSRPMPKVVGCGLEGDALATLKGRERVEDVVAFWS
jgi:diaminopimelate decarboxylase